MFITLIVLVAAVTGMAAGLLLVVVCFMVDPIAATIGLLIFWLILRKLGLDWTGCKRKWARWTALSAQQQVANQRAARLRKPRRQVRRSIRTPDVPARPNVSLSPNIELARAARRHPTFVANDDSEDEG